jgi:2-dehydro-3-deoxyphosphogluconate aldolase/(4S)-4-hydroxy-2-oxoglutarate aldolase
MDFLRIAIARGINRQALIPAFESVIDGGFIHLEITMNTPGALDQIADALAAFDGRAVIGAGTVVTLDQCRDAISAGAKFIVSPITDIPVIEYCNERKVPVFPGAMTPGEIYRAWTAGATMVKVFPVSQIGGASFIREIKGPFDEIKLLACGGVTPENISDYIHCGADGFAAGGQLFNKDWIANGEFDKIREKALKYSTHAAGK